MNIDDNLTQLRNISDNLILRLNENGTEIRVIKQKVIDIKEQIHTLKDEKYYKYSRFYKDDLEFQISYYYNIYIYHRSTLDIKKNKIFYDIYVYYNLIRYLIRYSIKYLKSNHREFRRDKTISSSLLNKNHYKGNDIMELFNNTLDNMIILTHNINMMSRTLEDINPLNPSHFLMIDNIHADLNEKIESIKKRFTIGITNLDKIINYHIRQLEVFRDNLKTEIDFINTDMYMNFGESMQVQIEINPDNNNREYTVGDNIEIRIIPIKGINENSEIGIQINGENTLELVRINWNEGRYIYNYQIQEGLGICNIEVIYINAIFNNANINIEGNATFTIVNADDVIRDVLENITDQFNE